MEKLLIFPFNGNGLEAVDCIAGQYELIGFIDDTPEKQGKTSYGFEVFGRNILDKYKEAKVLAVPGSPQTYKNRVNIIGSLNLPLEKFATVIHPNASVSSMAQIGKNILLMAGVVVTSNAVIGSHVCVLPNSVIHHDTTIGDYTLVGSNVMIAGNVMVGKNCYIASGSNIINNIEIGDQTLVGLGSNVIRNISAYSVVAGNPAKNIA
jgi:sugar O-acyltransferase (sialic acid O-acetyltransferase NeuD family)